MCARLTAYVAANAFDMLRVCSRIARGPGVTDAAPVALCGEVCETPIVLVDDALRATAIEAEDAVIAISISAFISNEGGIVAHYLKAGAGRGRKCAQGRVRTSYFDFGGDGRLLQWGRDPFWERRRQRLAWARFTQGCSRRLHHGLGVGQRRHCLVRLHPAGCPDMQQPSYGTHHLDRDFRSRESGYPRYPGTRCDDRRCVRS